MGNAIGKVLQKIKGDIFYRSRHGVTGIDGTDDDWPCICTGTVLNANRFEIRNNGKVLPNFAFQPVLGEFFAQDGIGFTYCLQTIPRDSTYAANAQAGAGKGLTIDHGIGESKLLSDNTNLILEQEFDGFDKRKLQVLGQTTDIMVGFHTLALDDVRIDGSLCKEFDPFLLAGLFFKDTDELGTDNLALLLRVGNTGQFVEEPIYGIDIDKVCIHLVTENTDHLFGLAFAKETVIDVYANQLLSDGADEQGSDDGGIHTAGEGKEYLLITDLLFECFNLLGDESFGKLGRRDAFHGFGTFFSHRKTLLS